ncbi:MAG: HmuY family protein [Longimicrobiales bacterium]
MAGIGVLLTAVLVSLTLRRTPPPAFPPTPPAPGEVGSVLVGPVTYTIDARSSREWVFFDFSRGSTVERPGPTDWDIAVRRFRVIANGGAGFAGDGALADLGEVPFDSVAEAPIEGWIQSVGQRVDSANAAIHKWYDYGFTSHLLTPRPNVWAVRTADGRYARFEILGYYCPGATPGCLTIRYVYQGSGTRSFKPDTRHDST